MKIAFASCFHPLKHPSQPAWLDVASHKPDLVLLIGDNTYFEDHWWQIFWNRPALRLDDDAFATYVHERYRRQWQVAEFQTMLRSVHARGVEILGTVDDHDFLGNDLAVTEGLANKAKIARVMHRLFIQACNAPLNEAFPPLPDWRKDPDRGFDEGLGLAFSRRYDDTLLVVLDNRSFRQDPGSGAVALGSRQMHWLQDQLNSNQRVSLIFSGSPLTKGTKFCAPGSPLSQYPTEYRELRAMYKACANRNIVHIGGDLHYNEYKGRNEHVDLIEVCSSGLGTGFQPFSPGEYGNYGIIEHRLNELLICTYGRESDRNVHHAIPI